jgi:hypothetical protein
MRWLTRLLLLRILPRRLLPILAVWDLVKLVRAARAMLRAGRTRRASAAQIGSGAPPG